MAWFRHDTLYGFITIQTDALNNHLVTIDTNTLAATDVGDVGSVFGGSAGLAYDPERDVFYLGGDSQAGLYSIDPISAQATHLGDHGLNELSGLVYVVPEPSALGAMAVGATVLLARLRRRRACVA